MLLTRAFSSVAFALLILLAAIPFAAVADSTIQDPYSNLRMPQDQISDFPGENVVVQTQFVNYDYTDINIPGPEGLDLVLRRSYKQRVEHSQFAVIAGFGSRWELDIPYIKITNNYNNESPIYGFGCVTSSTRFHISFVLGGQSLTTVGYPSASSLPSGALLAFSNGAVFRCNGNTPTLLMPNGTVIEYNKEIATAGNHFATRIKDRFGNYIQFNYGPNTSAYTNSIYTIAKLNSITRNDGARIDFDYVNFNGRPHILRARYGNRSVEYGYIKPYQSNHTVAWADDSMGRRTSFNYYRQGDISSVTNPNGARASYIYTTINPDQGRVGQLRSKEITGPDIEGRSFTYLARPSYWYVGHLELIVTETNGFGTQQKETIYTYRSKKTGPFYRANEPSLDTVMNGTIRRIEVFKGGTPQLRNGTLQYDLINDWTYVRHGSVGCNKLMSALTYSYHYQCARPLLAKQTHRVVNSGGIDTYVEDPLSYDVYGYETQSKSLSDDSQARYTKKTYLHDLANWILGLPRVTYRSTNNYSWIQEGQTVYWGATHAYKSLPRYEYIYGGLTRQFTNYHPSGELKRIDYNGSSRYEILENYKRGTPQKISAAKRYSSGADVRYRVVDDFGNITSDKNFNGVEVRFAYDALDRMIRKDYVSGAWADENTTYDDVSNYALNRIGNNHQYSYFDSLGRLIKVLNQDISDIGTRTYTRFTYDKQGDLTFRSFPSANYNPTIGVIFEHDSLGRRTKETIQPSNTVRTWTYLSGHRVQAVDGRGEVNTLDYRSFGALYYATPISITQTPGSSSGNPPPPPPPPPPGPGPGPGPDPCFSLAGVKGISEAVVWCRKREPLVRTYLGSGTALSVSGGAEPVAMQSTVSTNIVTSITYNLFDNVTRVVQGGIAETFVYDNYQRLCKKYRPETGITAFGYNAQRQAIWLANGTTGPTNACGGETSSHKVNIAYDNRGDVRSKTLANGSLLVQNTFDPAGNLTRLRSNTTISDYTFNDRNLVSTQLVTIDGISFSTAWTYDSLASISSVRYPDNRLINAPRNALGQQTAAGNYVTNARYHESGGLESFYRLNGVNRTVQYDAAGLLQAITDLRGGSTRFKHEYSYDKEFNVTNIYDRVQSSYNLTGLQYDGLNRLTGGAGQWGAIDIDYDDTSNILRMQLGSKTLNYNYASNNRLASISGTISKSYNYDNRGNVTYNGDRSFAFNNDNQMTSSSTISFSYDGKGLRVKKQSGSSRDYFIYSPEGQLLHKRAANGLRTNYVYLDDELMAKVTSSVTYTHNDAIGSVAVETNASGNVVKRYHYEPFGRALESGQQDDPGYTGHLYDDDLKLNYMKARYFDPLIGRFYSNDPVGFVSTKPTSFNRYAYANNNPYKYVDPNGEWGLLVKGLKLVAKGGDIVGTFAGAVSDFKTLTGKGVSPGTRAIAALSLATEILSPVSARDAKALGKMAENVRSSRAASNVPNTTARGRAGEIHDVLDPRAQRARTTAVTETQEGVRVVSSSERRLTPAQRSRLGPNEIEGVGVGHAETTGISAARAQGLTPTGTAASRPICPECARALGGQGIEPLSPLK